MRYLLLLFSLVLLMAQKADAQKFEIAQTGPHNDITIRAIGPKGRWDGFDTLADGKLVATTHFTSLGLITCRNVAIAKDGDISTLIFDDLKAEPNCGLTLENSRVEVALQSRRFPVIRFELHIAAFDPARWQKTLGRQPFHFLTLERHDATQAHQGGTLFPAASIPAGWSATPPLSAQPVPVIGLWSPKNRVYAAWDFLPSRLEDNSERGIATGYCRSLESPLKNDYVSPPLLPGKRTPPGKLIFPPPGPAQSKPRLVLPHLTETSAGNFVTLVYPAGGTGSALFAYPGGGENLASQTRLIFDTNLSRDDEPNRLLWEIWWNDAALRNRLPRVPATIDFSRLPDALSPKTLAETGTNGEEDANGIRPLLETYAANESNLHNHARALQAREQARRLAYRSLIFWIGTGDRRNALDSAFLWPAGGGDLSAKLDTLALAAVQNGDPVLLWALQGSLSRFPLPPPGKAPKIYAEASGPLRLLAPVGDTDTRLLLGEETALAFSRHAVVTLSDYERDSNGAYTVTVHSGMPQIRATVTIPGVNLRDKSVFLRRNRVIKIRLAEGKQVQRDSAAPDTLLISGLHNGDTLLIGELEETTATAMPLASPKERQ